MYSARRLNALGRRVDDLRTAVAAVAADENVGIVAHETRAVDAQTERLREIVARSLAECAKNRVAFDHVRAPSVRRAVRADSRSSNGMPAACA